MSAQFLLPFRDVWMQTTRGSYLRGEAGGTSATGLSILATTNLVVAAFGPGKAGEMLASRVAEEAEKKFSARATVRWHDGSGFRTSLLADLFWEQRAPKEVARILWRGCVREDAQDIREYVLRDIARGDVVVTACGLLAVPESRGGGVIHRAFPVEGSGFGWKFCFHPDEDAGEMSPSKLEEARLIAEAILR